MGCPPLSRRPEIVCRCRRRRLRKPPICRWRSSVRHERQRRRSGVDVVVEIDYAVFVLPFAVIRIGFFGRRSDRFAQFGQVFQRVDARFAVFDDGAFLADVNEFADYGIGCNIAAFDRDDGCARTVLLAERKCCNGNGLFVGGSTALCGDETHPIGRCVDLPLAVRRESQARIASLLREM